MCIAWGTGKATEATAISVSANIGLQGIRGGAGGLIKGFYNNPAAISPSSLPSLGKSTAVLISHEGDRREGAGATTRPHCPVRLVEVDSSALLIALICRVALTKLDQVNTALDICSMDIGDEMSASWLHGSYLYVLVFARSMY